MLDVSISKIADEALYIPFASIFMNADTTT